MSYCICQVFLVYTFDIGGFPGGSDGDESAFSAGDLGSIPGLGRHPGEGNGCPLQYSCLENSMNRGAWRGTVHGVAELYTTEWLSLSLFHINSLTVIIWNQSLLLKWITTVSWKKCLCIRNCTNFKSDHIETWKNQLTMVGFFERYILMNLVQISVLLEERF